MAQFWKFWDWEDIGLRWKSASFIKGKNTKSSLLLGIKTQKVHYFKHFDFSCPTPLLLGLPPLSVYLFVNNATLCIVCP